jgi:molybdopterin-guanine dinucleotide biosynthesis adapter protein
MKIFSITGWSGSGKTTLVTRLIKHFSSQGKRVIAVKSAPHKYYLEPESADTFKFLEAGAGNVYLAAKKELLSMRHVEEQSDIFAILEREVTDDNCDILLLEGLRRDDIPMMEVYNTTKNEPPKFSFPQLVAIISNQPVTDEIPNFDIDNIKDISTFMEAYHE